MNDPRFLLPPRSGKANFTPSALSADQVPLLEEHSQTLRRFGGNHRLFRRMVERFSAEIHRLAVELKEACVASDKARLAAILHSYRGVAANMGAVRLAEEIAHLQRNITDGSSDDALISVDELRYLRDLADASVDALIGNAQQATKTNNQTTVRQTEELLGRLREIQVMLMERDLKIIPAMERLMDAHSDIDAVTALFEQVQVLDFAAAQVTLEELMRKVTT